MEDEYKLGDVGKIANLGHLVFVSGNTIMDVGNCISTLANFSDIQREAYKKNAKIKSMNEALDILEEASKDIQKYKKDLSDLINGN